VSVDPVALAIPAFFVLIGLEALGARALGRPPIRFNDALTDLSCGILNQLLVALLKGVLLVPYVAIYEGWRLFDLGSGPAVHVFTFLAVDLLYYCWHRWTHETGLGWASHVVHHQSEDYHLSVALRQSLTSPLTSWPFDLPLALLGVPLPVLLVHKAFNLLYQFWIHTELVPRLGLVEGVLNTPSHHRVHHAINTPYLDKNYAGVLIVWDRLFGTFTPEGEPCRYGTLKPLNSFDPLWANVDVLWQWTKDFARAGWADRLRLLYRGPAFRPEGAAPLPTTRLDAPRYDPPLSRGLRAWLALQFVPVALGLLALLVWGPAWPWPARALAAALLALGPVAWGALVERRRFAPALEGLRLALSVAGLLWFGTSSFGG
jgi:sterol desaturase/sphingolipid hydroxylase (fatty acid hydroxylase superfamily)